MNFVDAVKAGFSNYFNFATRSSRSEYWWWILFLILASILISIIEGLENRLLSSIFSLITLVPNIAVSVRRLHDLDKSGWWYLLWLVPIVGWVIMIYWHCQPGEEGENRFGGNPLDPVGADVETVFE